MDPLRLPRRVAAGIPWTGIAQSDVEPTQVGMPRHGIERLFYASSIAILLCWQERARTILLRRLSYMGHVSTRVKVENERSPIPPLSRAARSALDPALCWSHGDHLH